MRIFVWTLVVLATLVVAPPVEAHKPLTIGGDAGADPAHAVQIEDIDVSQVVYRALTPELPQLWLRAEGRAGEAFQLELGVPEIDRLSGFRPALAVIGPGLPAGELPFSRPPGVPADAGVLLLHTGDLMPRAFHEPFSATDSWILGKLSLTLPADGVYHVVAFHPAGEAGKLWVAVGQREAFGAGDLAQMVDWLAAVRDFHEVEGPAPLVRAWNWTLVGLAGLLAAGIWWAVVRR